MKRIGLTGASGLIGRAFAVLAENAGYDVIRYSRNVGNRPGWRSIHELDVSGLDAIVHLAGEPVLGLWTAAKKQRIMDSRADLTARIAQSILQAKNPPTCLITASGSNFYGNRGDEILTEASPAGPGFLSEVVQALEGAAFQAAPATRVAAVRFPMVFGQEGGGYAAMSRIFKLGLGGRLGSGKQWWPWIHVQDAAGLLMCAIENNAASGVINGVAPDTVTNADFTRQLARSLGRPAFLLTPAFVLKMLPGGMGRIFLDSIRIQCSRASELGYAFAYASLPAALQDLKVSRADPLKLS